MTSVLARNAEHTADLKLFSVRIKASFFEICFVIALSNVFIYFFYLFVSLNRFSLLFTEEFPSRLELLNNFKIVVCIVLISDEDRSRCVSLQRQLEHRGCYMLFVHKQAEWISALGQNDTNKPIQSAPYSSFLLTWTSFGFQGRVRSLTNTQTLTW